ncbi:hypothetical protein IWX90DRAFT_494794 [Phyllosticta citrichinensis]|uniref:Uncharacterized protein n=1 Tax=Phyllosticta citrichinensis TaxID=1130410 RepID=A0ABR1XHH0_9PEZI
MPARSIGLPERGPMLSSQHRSLRAQMTSCRPLTFRRFLPRQSKLSRVLHLPSIWSCIHEQLDSSKELHMAWTARHIRNSQPSPKAEPDKPTELNLIIFDELHTSLLATCRDFKAILCPITNRADEASRAKFCRLQDSDKLALCIEHEKTSELHDTLRACGAYSRLHNVNYFTSTQFLYPPKLRTCCYTWDAAEAQVSTAAFSISCCSSSTVSNR